MKRRPPFEYARVLTENPCSHIQIASFSNDKGNSNENVKKAVGLITNLLIYDNNSACALHFLVHFFAVNTRLGREILDGKVYGGRKHTRRIFLSLSKLGCGLQEFSSIKFHLHLTFKAKWTE